MAVFTLDILKRELPQAYDKVFVIDPTEMKELDVTLGDFLGEAPSIVTIEITPTSGTSVVSGQKIEYTPSAGFVGSDFFYYRITDSLGNFDMARITLNIE